MPADLLATASVPDLFCGISLYVPARTGGGGPPPLNTQAITDLLGWGQGAWLRWQYKWDAVEQSYTKNADGTLSPVYTWTNLDDGVSQLNAAGINICIPIQSAPVWRNTIDASSGKTLVGNGTTCNTHLSIPITADGTTVVPAISVLALGAGSSLVVGQQISIDYGVVGRREDIKCQGNYGPGAVSITVSDLGGNPWIPASSHTTKSNVLNSGADLPNAADTAVFAKALATRYNGQSGHGLVQAIQVGNEDWDTLDPRDDQGKWLAPVVAACYPVIKKVHPTCRVGVCAVRKTPKLAVAHIQAWLTNLFTWQGGCGPIDWLDFHYYRDGSTAGPDPALEDKNTPSVSTEVKVIRQTALSVGGQSPEVWCGETGWNIFDDGTGQLNTLATTLASGSGPYTAITLATPLSGFTSAQTPIYVDFGNGNQETLFVWANANKGATVVQISTSITNQVAWTPSSTHAAGAPAYVAATNGISTSAQNATYLREMYEGVRLNGGTHCFAFTMQPDSQVLPYSHIGPGAGPNAVYATTPKSFTQTITYPTNQGYQRLEPYAMTVAYVQKYPTWTGSSSGGTNQNLLSSRFKLASPVRNRRIFSRFNLSLASVTQAKRLLSARYKLLSVNKQLLFSRFNLQGAATSRIRLLASRYRLRGVLATLTLPGRLKLLPGSTIALPPPPDALPSFFTAPTTAVHFGIGTYQSLPGSATKTIDGGFHFQPGAVFHPYAGTYGGTYGYLLDTTIKQPQQTQYTPATEIGLDASGVSVVRGFPQITWSYTTMRPDYWYYLQQVFRQAGKAPPGFQYLVLIQYPSNDGSNTAVQQLARMNPPTFNYRTVAAFYGVSLLFQYVDQAQLAQTVPIVLLSP